MIVSSLRFICALWLVSHDLTSDDSFYWKRLRATGFAIVKIQQGANSVGNTAPSKERCSPAVAPHHHRGPQRSVLCCFRYPNHGWSARGSSTWAWASRTSWPERVFTASTSSKRRRKEIHCSVSWDAWQMCTWILTRLHCITTMFFQPISKNAVIWVQHILVTGETPQNIRTWKCL